jgi:hypothetical protein
LSLTGYAIPSVTGSARLPLNRFTAPSSLLSALPVADEDSARLGWILTATSPGGGGGAIAAALPPTSAGDGAHPTARTRATKRWMTGADRRGMAPRLDFTAHAIHAIRNHAELRMIDVRSMRTGGGKSRTSGRVRRRPLPD